VRPHALYSEATANLKIPLVPLPNHVYELTQHTMCKDEGVRFDTKAVVVKGRNKPVNLQKGGVIKGQKNQCDWDFLAYLPQRGDTTSTAIISQEKYKQITNNQGKPTEKSNLSKATLDNGPIILERAKSEGFAKTIVVEFVSDRRLSNQKYRPPDGISVICERNWEQAMGPLFGQSQLHLRDESQLHLREILTSDFNTESSSDSEESSQREEQSDSEESGQGEEDRKRKRSSEKVNPSKKQKRNVQLQPVTSRKGKSKKLERNEELDSSTPELEEERPKKKGKQSKKEMSKEEKPKKKETK